MHKSTKKQKKQDKKALVEYAGWLGVVLLLSNYALLASGFFRGDTIIYHSVALLGCFFVAYEAWQKRDKQPAILNFVFVGIAVFAIVRIGLV